MKILISVLATIALSINVRADDSLDNQIRNVIQAHERLKAAVAETEGSIEIIRANAGEKLQPYIKGNFFNGNASFRADFEAWNLNAPETELGARQLVALDRKHSYQLLTISVDVQRGMLYVRGASYPGVKILVDTAFKYKINSLWSAGGRPIVDMMQQPNASFEISDSDGISDALIVTVSEAGAEARYTLDPSHDYACRRAMVETESQMVVDISIEFTTMPGGEMVPSQLHERGYIGKEYREETKLVISRAEKKLPTEFSNDSFVDFGLDYAVSTDDQVPQGTFFGADWSNSTAPSPGSPVYFWIVSASLVAIGLALIYRTWRTR